MASGNPFVVGVGAQKAGTTWLGNYFRHHPEVYIPEIKEMHFFDVGPERPLPDLRFRLARDLNRRTKRALATLHDGHCARPDRFDQVMREVESIAARAAIGEDLDAYIAHYREHGADASIWADITPAYALLSAEQFAEMDLALDRPRYLFLLRNPVDRLLSQISFSERHENWSRRAVEDYLEMSSFIGRSTYERTLAALEGPEAEGRVLVMFYETLFGRDMAAEIGRLADFLSIAPGPEPSPRHDVIERRPLDFDLRALCYGKLSETYRYFADRFGDRLPHAWQADISEFADT